MSESEVEIQVGIIRSMLSTLPETEQDLLAPAFAKMRFQGTDDVETEEVTDPFELDEGIVSLADTVSSIYAWLPEPPEQSVESASRSRRRRTRIRRRGR